MIIWVKPIYSSSAFRQVSPSKVTDLQQQIAHTEKKPQASYFGRIHYILHNSDGLSFLNIAGAGYGSVYVLQALKSEVIPNQKG